ncbi:MAG: chloride channel protein [Burkholderiaceae bacterium]|nr:chloride channel protein [Burkholderiaceae bacterium]
MPYRRQPDFFRNLRAELVNRRLWVDRAIVLGYAVLAGLFVVGMTLASNEAFALFERLRQAWPWAVLLWMPALTAGIVYLTRRWFPGAAGSGIPQIKAALYAELPPERHARFASLRLTLGKIALTVAGFAAGLSIGREGPSVQVAAGVMQHARRWLSHGSAIDPRALLTAGGAAGIAATFNAPLAGVLFAIEELSGRIEARQSGIIITAIVLAGLVAISVLGNHTYFGVIHVPRLEWGALGPGLLVALGAGLSGGLFSRLMSASLTGAPWRLNRWRARWPVGFAAACGLVLALIGLASGGATFGSGSETVKHMLDGHDEFTPLQTLLKFIATWISAWSGAPGGIFAPTLAFGAGLGHAVTLLTHQVTGSALDSALIALGMTGFLAAVTQAPLTAFIIVMEMVDGHAMVLSLMASAMLASLTSRMISRPLYEVLAKHMLYAALPPSSPPIKQ